jgi:hypothetical protein
MAAYCCLIYKVKPMFRQLAEKEDGSKLKIKL